MNIKNRTLFIADNLYILRGINSECIDLIYLDPPFNTNRTYKAPIGSPAEGAQFKDIWTDEDIKYEWHGHIAEQHEELYQIIQASEKTYDKSMKIYLTAMAVRLFEMKRILKPTGSIYLHCDPTASHYLKLVMDSLFGKKNFRNELVWGYPASPSAAKKDFPRKHDIILRYTKSDTFIFNDNSVRVAYSESSMERIKYAANASTVMSGTEIELNKNGKIPPSIWTDIQQSYRYRKEHTGYPTQKPLKLLERIIQASSDEGDVVLDPFCGCATACVAAEKLQRQWIGIDISPSAEVITKIRLQDMADKEALLKMEDGKSLLDFNVNVETAPPVRTDNTEDIASQQKLPMYQTHKPELFGRQQGHCNGCQYPFHYRNFTVDHIIPRTQGGTDHFDNLQLLCQACNSTKGQGTHADLIQKLKANNIIQSGENK